MMAERLSPEDSRILALESSSIVGHTSKVVIAEPIREVYSLAEIAPHHALRVSAISFAGRIAIGLCADGDAIPELSELAEGVERSLVELTEGVTA
jgi:diacylglycerol O-acyltransferase